jgi:hypothetical protein
LFRTAVEEGPLPIGFEQQDITRRQDAGGECPLAGKFEPVPAVGASEPQHPEIGSHALLGMLARAEEPVDIVPMVSPSGAAPRRSLWACAAPSPDAPAACVPARWCDRALAVLRRWLAIRTPL